MTTLLERPDLGEPYKILGVNGSPTEFFLIGSLAAALNRSPQTVRYWMDVLEAIPRGYTINVSRNKDWRGRRRVFSREQIEAAVIIAAEEGLLDDLNKHVMRTNFAERLAAAWMELR